jgi:hypothetical protein
MEPGGVKITSFNSSSFIHFSSLFSINESPETYQGRLYAPAGRAFT